MELRSRVWFNTRRVNLLPPKEESRPMSVQPFQRPASIVTYIAVAAAVVASDLWSKTAVFEFLGAELRKLDGGNLYFNPGTEHQIIDGWFSFEASRNLGAFSGWFSDFPMALLGISLIAVVVTLGIAAFPRTNSRMMVVSLGLLAGGAMGNLYDRFTYGAVRDFLKVYRGDAVWPNFNIADAAICTGVGLLFLREILMARAAKREQDASEGEAPTAEPTPAREEPPAAERTPQL